MREQRLRTVRSHASVRFDGVHELPKLADSAQLAGIVKPVLKALPDDSYKRGRAAMLAGYVADMHRVFEGIAAVVVDSAPVAVVVGNSLHGRNGDWLIASDLLLAAVAEASHFECERILVARRPPRRGGNEPLLRESVIMLRKRPALADVIDKRVSAATT